LPTRKPSKTSSWPLAQGSPAAAAYAPRELDDHSFAPEDIAIARYRQRRVVLQSCEIFATLDKSFHSVTLQIRFSAPLSRSYNRWGWGMVSHFINEPEHWLARAEEARMLANQMNDAEAKVAMLRIAEDYERLAQRAEGRALGRLPNSN
jgi:hypothetical protein